MIRRNQTDLLPRLRWLPPWHALKVLASNLLGRNSPVATKASDTQIAGLQRHRVSVSLPTVDSVSFLQSGHRQGRRIIFVHGTPGNANGWADYLIDVPDGRCHMALDRPGYGRSPSRQPFVPLELQAKAVLSLLKAARGKKAVIVGHSSGAAVAVQTALDHHHAVGGLLLLAGAVDPDLEEANWIQLLGTLKPISRLLPKAIDTANRELLGLKGDLLAQADRLHRITIPVGVVHGDRDPLVPLGNTDYLRQKLNRAPIDETVLAQADHFIPWHSKAAIDRALERLILRVRRTEQ